MMSSNLVESALKRATDTKACVVSPRAAEQLPKLLRAYFPGAVKVVVVDDPRTRAAAGEGVFEFLKIAGFEISELVLEPGGRTFHADYFYVEKVREFIAKEARLQPLGIIPLAVGSGVINDLVKLAAGELSLPYAVLPTAASVDGYSSFGAAIRSPEGAKQTYSCPAPRVIVADIDIMRTAPRLMTASGYADLLAKVPAGADWILAFEFGASEWHQSAWFTAQDGLKEAVGDPEGVANHEEKAFTRLVEGLLLSGFAMQDMQSSRPASGAEHLFSHLLEMRDHTCQGQIVPHGIQVGVFTLYMTKVYERMLAVDYSKLDIEKCVARWKSLEEQELLAARVFSGTKFLDLGVKSVRAKYVKNDVLRERLERFCARWPEIKRRLEKQLLPSVEIERRLKVVGAPFTPASIGSTDEAAFSDAAKAVFMRDRFMLLDFLSVTGELDAFTRIANN